MCCSPTFRFLVIEFLLWHGESKFSILTDTVHIHTLHDVRDPRYYTILHFKGKL